MNRHDFIRVFPNQFRGFLETRQFSRRHVDLQNVGGSHSVKDGGNAGVDVIFPILALQQSGDGNDAVLIVQNCLDDARAGCGYAIVSRALSVEDFPAFLRCFVRKTSQSTSPTSSLLSAITS